MPDADFEFVGYEGQEITALVGVDDGFGNLWLKCSRPDCDLSVVRPGKVQCSKRPCEQNTTYIDGGGADD